MVKLIAGGLVLVVMGVPVLETWEALFLGASLLALVFGVCRPGWRRLAAAAALVLAIVACKGILPRADIAEAHNPFMVMHDGEALQSGLPAEVFRSWRAQFDALYPAEGDRTTGFDIWRGTPSLNVPRALFTQSADAIWRRAKYTRQVDAIEFRSLGEFRGGFANESQYNAFQAKPLYNFWAGPLRRETMPFYVMYELTSASVGSELAWKGQVFWQRPDGGFEEINHSDIAAQTIEEKDAGRRVYAASFPLRDPSLFFQLKRSLTLRVAAWMARILSVAGALSVLLLTIRPRTRSYLRALSIFLAGYVFIVVFLAVSAGQYLGKTYPPLGGGDDGIVHEGWGRTMAILAGRGEIVDALRGTEAVYWFTPGTRYVRMVEKLVFGDTNHLFALAVPCVLIVIFYVMRHFLGTRLAWIVTAIVFVLPVGSISYLQYIANAKLGYGEAIAGGLFFLGLVLMLRTQPAWGGTDRTLTPVWVAGAALSASMFIRPNFALAVVWLGAAYTWASWKRRDVAVILALAAGLGLALWMPLHNWFYGGEFYLISKSGLSVAVPLGVGDYASALADLMHGRVDTDAVIVTSRQLKGWLWDPGYVVRPALMPLAWAAHAIKLLALAVTCWIAARWVGRGVARADLAVVAVAAIVAHLPMLFIISTYSRYAMLAWDLNLVVLIVWLARLRRPLPILDPDAHLSPV